jgi:hypothetical protein
MMSRYWEAFGWDAATGKPTAESLRSLDTEEHAPGRKEDAP